jgi:hypothetical protein
MSRSGDTEPGVEGLPAWARAIRRERTRRRLSNKRLAWLLREDAKAAGEGPPELESLITTVRRWQRGEHHPDERYQERLAKILEAPHERLFAGEPFATSASADRPVVDPRGGYHGLGGDHTVHSPGSQEDQEETNRREFSIGTATFVTSAVVNGSLGWLTGANDRVDALERLARALAGGRRVDTVTLDYLDERFAGYWQDYHVTKLPASELVPYALDDLNRVSGLLESSLSPSSRTRVNTIAARAATVVGALLWDMRAYAKSRECLRMGVMTAREANERSMEAVAWAWSSFGWMYDSPTADGWRKALDCASAGRELCPSNSGIGSWLAAIEAEVHANVGDRSGCFIALRDAERAIDLTPSSPDWFWSRFDQAGLAGYRGVCQLRLDGAIEARRALSEALELLDASEQQRRLTLMIDLARAYAKEDAMEEACARARDAMRMAADLRSPVKAQRLQPLRRDLEVRRDATCVRILEEELMADTTSIDRRQ